MFTFEIEKFFSPLAKAISFQEAGNLNMINIVYFYDYVFLFLIFIFVIVSFLLIKTLYYFSIDCWYFLNKKKYYFILILKFTLAYCEYNLCKFFGKSFINKSNFNLKTDVYFKSFSKRVHLEYRSYFTNDSILEFWWTIIPAFILGFIAGPSFEILFRDNYKKTPEITIQVIGHQWYWEYQYLDYAKFLYTQIHYKFLIIPNDFFNNLEEVHAFQKSCQTASEFCIPGLPNKYKFLSKNDIVFQQNNFSQCFIHILNYLDRISVSELKPLTVEQKFFLAQYIILSYTFNNEAILPIVNKFIFTNKSETSYIINSYLKPVEDLVIGEFRLLEVDKEIFIPQNVPVRFLVTSDDVLHSWAIPALGIKVDACPGRINQIIETIQTPGKYYGQCSELCGLNHGFMPIVLRVVDSNTWNLWTIVNFYKITSLPFYNFYTFLNERINLHFFYDAINYQEKTTIYDFTMIKRLVDGINSTDKQFNLEYKNWEAKDIKDKEAKRNDEMKELMGTTEYKDMQVNDKLKIRVFKDSKDKNV